MDRSAARRPSKPRPKLRRGTNRTPDSAKATRCRRKFLRYFPGGFTNADYLASERDYKWETHDRWMEMLGPAEFRRLIRRREFSEIAQRAIRVEQSSAWSMIFSFEKMSLRDAVRSGEGAQLFAEGLDYFLHGRGLLRNRFTAWVNVLDALPRKQTRVLTWPTATVFGFLAQPQVHLFFKPNVTRRAAAAYGFELPYTSRPGWATYEKLLELAGLLKRDLRDLKARDMIDVQSFLWVLGSDEYP